MKGLLLAISIVLAACEEPLATSRPVVGPDGTRWWAVACREDMTNCYEQAGAQCPAGYDVAASSSQEGTHSRTLISHDRRFAVTKTIPMLSANLLIRCKANKPPVVTNADASSEFGY